MGFVGTCPLLLLPFLRSKWPLIQNIDQWHRALSKCPYGQSTIDDANEKVQYPYKAYQQVHDENRHDDDEEREDGVGDAFKEDRGEEVFLLSILQGILGAQVVLAVEDDVEVQFPDHHYKSLDERIVNAMERLLCI